MAEGLNYITTFSKIHFAPTNPKFENIKIEDIAHALSLLCRANGHFKHFFSVAQHSINCAREASACGCSKNVQLACLLHDASEAYLSDITRPLKAQLPEYVAIENDLQSMIYNKFLEEPLTEEDYLEIKRIDDAMLFYEFVELMDEKLFSVEPKIESLPSIKVSDFGVVESQFLSEFDSLTTGVINNYFPDKPFLSVGIDGCAGKWAVVALSEHGFEIALHKNITEICEKYGNAHSVIIDMPIGLVESDKEIRPDQILRKNLKGKASSVFNTPCRQAVYASGYSAAIAENQKVLNLKITPLSNAIIPKIKEIDTFLRDNPNWKNRLVESHPEYCFALLNGGTPISQNKQTPEGVNTRLILLSKYYADSYRVIERFQKLVPKMAKTPDDVLDALALAIIGAIGLRFGFTTLPEKPSKDSAGLYMQIVGANILASR
ncbi:DUF429 domain-containing protein [Ruminococcaceae bacterium OttesenSCG-928-L11]|nr:DUF429 domain-containing protein [Ruminococcaceae bacterium OttesenSCG-928-L11]